MSSPSSATQQAYSPAAEEVPERPALAPDVELAGPMQGMGFPEQLWLVKRGCQLLQLPEPYYRVAEQVDGERTFEEIAAAVLESSDWLISAELVRQIIEEKLIPIGLVRAADGSVLSRTEDRNDSPLQVDLHRQEIVQGAVHPIARVLRYLLISHFVIPLSIAAAVACAWLYFTRGVAAGIRTVLHSREVRRESG